MRKGREPDIRSHVTYTVRIKGVGRVIIEHGCEKGQPLLEHYHPQLVKGKAVWQRVKHNHCRLQSGIS